MRISVGVGRCIAACAAVAAWSVAGGATATDPAGDRATGRSTEAAMMVDVQQGDGSTTSGRLTGIGTADVRLSDATGVSVSLPVERVRKVRRGDVAADGGRRVLLTLVDGSVLSGDDCAWDGKRPLELVRPEGTVEIPAARVRSVAMLADAAGGSDGSRWQAAIPDGTSSDLVVVGNEDSHEFVECAITAISPETVTVILDEETIPVKRSKVIGMQWLRPAGGETQGRLAVAVTGGSLRGDRVEWSVEGLVVDGEIRLPAAMLSEVDYASGRTVGLTGLTAEKVAVEPWFGALGRDDGLDAFFAPRAVASMASGRPSVPSKKSSLIMRPRTVATWRLPPDSRRFRAVVSAAGGGQATDPVAVAVAVDDRELFRRQVDATASIAADEADASAGIPLDVDVTGGRRLTVTVDFGSAGGIGGAIVFIDPVVER